MEIGQIIYTFVSVFLIGFCLTGGMTAAEVLFRKLRKSKGSGKNC